MKSSKQREEEQQKRNKVIIGILVSVIMIGSTIGYFFGDASDSSGLEYKGKDGKKYSFKSSNGLLYTKINGKDMYFYSHPLDALSLNISDDAFSTLQNSPVAYLTFDPESKDIQYMEQARFDLEKDFPSLNKYLVTGVMQNSSDYKNFETITCKNATAYLAVISLVSANESYSRGFWQGNCLIFEGRRADFLRFRDYIVYKLYGVI